MFFATNAALLCGCFCVILLCSSLKTVAGSADFEARDKPSDADQRPNIILLITDDQDVMLGGIDHMTFLKEHLIQKGTTFANAFVHTPICCPSRSSILTGKYLHNGGAFNNSVDGNCNGLDWQQNNELSTFAVYAQQEGYVTSFAGKYLNQYATTGSPNCTENDQSGCNRVPKGWDKWLGLVGNSIYYNYHVVESNDGGNTARRIQHGHNYETDYLPDLLANRTLKMIEGFTSSEERRPFLLVNSWPSPHGPFTPATWAEGVFDEAKAHRTENWNASSKFMLQKHWVMRQQPPIDSNAEKTIDEMYGHRLETLLSVDDHIRQVIELLENKGELDNTWFIYTSDNGFQLGQHRLPGDKRHLYEHDIRVPFIVRGPGVAANQVRQEIVLIIDIAPTIYHLLKGSNMPPPIDFDGMSFIPTLLADPPNYETRDDFLISYHGEYVGEMPVIDCLNNTFHCVRTIVHGARENGRNSSPNSIYCRFIDNENFVEYYDMTQDEWQLHNLYKNLSEEERKWFDSRLDDLRRCSGKACRKIMMRPVVSIPPVE